ncbi:MAG TPA: Maf family protein [Acidimicrobiales bacterium]|nr:Maf family protein [Acidimicrobiales bacterium]
MRRLVLASASPARRLLLESAGLRPEVIASHIDEDGVDSLPAFEAVQVLARRKGEAVAADLADDPEPPLLVACDSLLDFEGEAWGKAADRAEVTSRWRRLRGRSGLLHTGHYVADLANGRRAEATDTALVRFGVPSDDEIEAYARSDESLRVAGPFTLEGRSAPWIDSIDGNFGTITGISLALLRGLLRELDVELIDLWS